MIQNIYTAYLVSPTMLKVRNIPGLYSHPIKGNDFLNHRSSKNSQEGLDQKGNLSIVYQKGYLNYFKKVINTLVLTHTSSTS